MNKSTFRTCAALLKMTAVDLGTETAGGKSVTDAPKDSEKAPACQGARAV